jgi:hypothetical protein
MCGSSGQCSSGHTCDGGICRGAEICTDGLDNDGDGLIDCADPDCATLSCGTGLATLKCSGTNCACNGVFPVPAEICNDGIDNDCDGMIDCFDSDCGGTAMCESNCADGINNGGSAAIDCADPSCNHRPCSTTNAWAICCGAVCTDVGHDPNNCGLCGVVCTSGSCVAVSSSNGVHSGECTCPGGLADCPNPSGTHQQACDSPPQCICDTDNDRCGTTSSGAKCSGDYCYYTK